ncbi:MAG: antitoxin VapB family protein [Candidatus Ranarchaeia archaeon]
MGVKNISIRDRVYKLLKQIKKDNESFSDVIEEILTGKRLDLKEFYGVLRDSQVLQEIEIHAEQMRKTARVRA